MAEGAQAERASEMTHGENRYLSMALFDGIR
jgi:hypothetical protein